eukprot:gene34718-42821_t
MGSNLNSLNWHKIYSSDLYRALHTTKLALDHSTSNEYSLEHISHSEWLREINFGVREGLSRSMNAHQAKIEYARLNNLNVDEVVDTAESLESVRHRQKNFILKVLSDHLLEKEKRITSDTDSDNNDTDSNFKNSNSSSVVTSTTNNANSTANNTTVNSEPHKVLCVSHGGYIKQFLKNFCHSLPAVEKIANCSVTIVTVEWVDTSLPEHFTCST